MRGKVMAFSAFAAAARITPAHAGKSRTVAPRAGSVEDHPRPCGEKPTVPMLTVVAAGSPPPMRGKVDADVCPIEGTRITPAHAGKSHYKYARICSR